MHAEGSWLHVWGSQLNYFFVMVIFENKGAWSGDVNLAWGSASWMASLLVACLRLDPTSLLLLVSWDVGLTFDRLITRHCARVDEFSSNWNLFSRLSFMFDVSLIFLDKKIIKLLVIRESKHSLGFFWSVVILKMYSMILWNNLAYTLLAISGDSVSLVLALNDYWPPHWRASAIA